MEFGGRNAGFLSVLVSVVSRRIRTDLVRRDAPYIEQVFGMCLESKA